MLQVIQAMLDGVRLGKIPPPLNGLFEPYVPANPESWVADTNGTVALWLELALPPVWETVTRVIAGDIVSIISGSNPFHNCHRQLYHKHPKTTSTINIIKQWEVPYLVQYTITAWL